MQSHFVKSANSLYNLPLVLGTILALGCPETDGFSVYVIVTSTASERASGSAQGSWFVCPHSLSGHHLPTLPHPAVCHRESLGAAKRFTCTSASVDKGPSRLLRNLMVCSLNHISS